MKRNIKGIIGYRIEATDGEIGKLDDIYFEDDSWTIRYLIIKMKGGLMAGGFAGGGLMAGGLPERKAFISPASLLPDRVEAGVLFVDHTRDQVYNSPNIDTDKPINRQQEIELYDHYAWKGYWESGFYAGGLGAAVDHSPAPARRTGADLHLRSALFVIGFHVHGVGCEIGYIDDFIFEDKTWKLLSLVVETRPIPDVKKMLISVGRVLQMRWSDSEVYLDETEAHIKEHEIFEPDAFTDARIL